MYLPNDTAPDVNAGHTLKPGDFVVYTDPVTNTRQIARIRERDARNDAWYCWFTEAETTIRVEDDRIKAVSDQTNPAADGPYLNDIDPMRLGGRRVLIMLPDSDDKLRVAASLRKAEFGMLDPQD